MSGRPLASIVIPVWNRPATLLRAVASALEQTEADLEVIVVDNGSDDRAAVQAVVDATGDGRVRLVRVETNRGPSGGRNAGAAEARGSLLGFLDSDDEFLPGWLAALAEPLGNKACCAATCGYQLAGSDRGEARPKPLGPGYYDVVACFQAGTGLVRADIFGQLGGYDERLWYGENTDLGLRLATLAHNSGLVVGVVDLPLMYWHRESARRDYARRRLEAAELMIDKHGEAIGRDPRLRTWHLAVAGVNAARLGEYGRARRHLFALACRRPAPRNIGRLALACVPPLARKVWSNS